MLLLVVEVGGQLPRHPGQFGTEAVRFRDGHVGQQARERRLHGPDGAVLLPQPVEDVQQVGVVALHRGEHVPALGRVVELQRLAERQAALPDLQPETGCGDFTRTRVGGPRGDVRLCLVVHVAQLAAQPGVHLLQLVGERGDRGSRRVGVGEFQHHDRQHPVRGVLVFRVPGRLGDDPGEEFVAPGPFGRYGEGLELLVPQLHAHGGVGEEVAVPVGVER